MAADDEKSKNQILQALDALSHTLYQARATRRTTSLALPRSTGAGDDADAAAADAVPALEAPRPLSRRLSLMSPFRSRPKLDPRENDDEEDDDDGEALVRKSKGFAAVTPEAAAADDERKGIWSWRPIRALAHIGMHRVGCLFSLEVVAAQGLPPTMNGLRLAVAVRRKEAAARERDGGSATMQTVPARVHKGAADFDETLYLRCHLFCSGGGASGKPLRFEPRTFLLSAVAVDAPELDFGQSAMDLSTYVKEFTDKCQQAGECPRQWDMAFPLAGKAKGGELVVKLAFQIIDDAGLGLVHGQPDGADKTTSSSSSFARKLSKSSFSIMSPKVIRSKLSLTPKMGVSSSPDLKDIDSFKLDDPIPAADVKVEQQKEPEHKPEEVKVEQQKQPEEPKPEVVVKEEEQKEAECEPEEAMEEDKKEAEPELMEEPQKEPEREPEDAKSDDSELPEFDVVDKGIEGQQEEKDELKEVAEAEKASVETTVLGAVPDAATKLAEQPEDEVAVAPDTNQEEVTGELSQVPEQGGNKGGAAKPSPPFIGWRTVAIVITPIAVIVGRTLGSMR